MHCNRVLQPCTATVYCNRVLQPCTATVHCNRVLQPCTATVYCNRALQPCNPRRCRSGACCRRPLRESYSSSHFRLKRHFIFPKNCPPTIAKYLFFTMRSFVYMYSSQVLGYLPCGYLPGGHLPIRIFARRIFARLILIFCFHVLLLLVIVFLFTLFLFLFNISTLKQGYKSLRTLLHSPNLTWQGAVKISTSRANIRMGRYPPGNIRMGRYPGTLVTLPSRRRLVVLCRSTLPRSIEFNCLYILNNLSTAKSVRVISHSSVTRQVLS